MKNIKIVFWLLVANFLLVLGNIFVPVLQDIFQGTFLFLLPMAILFLMGVLLVFLVRKEEVTGKLKGYLLLTGGGGAGFFLGSVLHNLFYALAIVSADIAGLKIIFEILHGTFFLIAVIACPLGFLVGMIGSACLLRSKKL